MALTRIAVLAGGRSTRMGQDKAQLRRGGATVLARVVAAARPLGAVAVVGRGPEPGLAVDVWLEDACPDAGPLAGIAAALAWADPAPVLILAVDLPLITAADVAWLAEQPAGPDGWVVQAGDHWDPLIARWHSSLRPSVTRALAAGRRSPLAVLTAAQVSVVTPPAPLLARLADCDTPQAWAALPPTDDLPCP